MSSGKFASVTASLLARKGEGQPWMQGGMQGAVPEPARMPLAWRNEGRNEGRSEVRSEVRVAPAAPPPPPPMKDKSCAVRMSLHDFERLGILAVKTGVTRQQLLKDALAQFLAAKAQDFGCACLGACERNCGQSD
jgi:predicted DNA-binding protein